jgi:hypothetical protein
MEMQANCVTPAEAAARKAGGKRSGREQAECQAMKKVSFIQ